MTENKLLFMDSIKKEISTASKVILTMKAFESKGTFESVQHTLTFLLCSLLENRFKHFKEVL